MRIVAEASRPSRRRAGAANREVKFQIHSVRSTTMGSTLAARRAEAIVAMSAARTTHERCAERARIGRLDSKEEGLRRRAQIPARRRRQ